MARKRMLDPNLFQSEDVAKLKVFSRYVFIGMISNADDEGKGRANANYLKSVIFPYDDVRTAEVEKALSEISQNTSVAIYLVDGQKYYKFQNWKKWQKVEKPSKSIIPDPFPEDSPNIPRILPDESRLIEEKRKEYNTPLYIPPLKWGGNREEKTSTGVSASPQQSAEPEDSSCLPSAEGSVSVEGSAPSQPKKTKKEKGATEAQIDEYFSKTWAIYPRKVSKVQARKTYEKKLSGRTSEEARMTANKIFLLLRSHMDEWEEKDREIEYIPHFSTWLNENIEDSPYKRRR